MKLYGLKDKEGKEYEITLPDMEISNVIDNRTFKLGDFYLKPVESVPEKKKLPKTKKGFRNIIMTFLSSPRQYETTNWSNEVDYFLNDYEDD